MSQDNFNKEIKMTDTQYQQLIKLFSSFDKPYLEPATDVWISAFNNGGFEVAYEQLNEILDVDYNPNINDPIYDGYTHSHERNHSSDTIPDTLYLDKRVQKKLIRDVMVVEFNYLYPTIMKRIIIDDKYQISTDLSKILDVVIEFRRQAKQELRTAIQTYQPRYVIDMIDTAQINAKAFVNFVYGKCNRSKYLKCSFNMSYYIRSEIGHMWRKIRQSLPHGAAVVYFDTDKGFIASNDNVSSVEVNRVLDSALIDYTVEKMAGVFFERSRSITMYPDDVPSKIRHNRREIRPSNWIDMY